MYCTICWARKQKSTAFIFLGGSGIACVLTAGLENLAKNPTTVERLWKNSLWGQQRSPGNGSIGLKCTFPTAWANHLEKPFFQSVFPLNWGMSCLSVSWLGERLQQEMKKRFRFCSMCRGLSVALGRTVPAQPLFPGCFQPHQVFSREAPGAQYFAGTGCICLPMSGFRDWSHWKILFLTLGYTDVICVCAHTISVCIYTHTFMLPVYI